HPATAKWYDRRDSVYIEFCVADSKDVKINFEKAKFVFSCLGGTDQVKHQNEVDLFEAIDQNVSNFIALSSCPQDKMQIASFDI
ncbi:unnamed protein product, partial [Coregonus sp. 'balchen']